MQFNCNLVHHWIRHTSLLSSFAGHDTYKLWADIEQVVVKTMLAVTPELQIAQNLTLRADSKVKCFQILGKPITILPTFYLSYRCRDLHHTHHEETFCWLCFLLHCLPASFKKIKLNYIFPNNHPLNAHRLIVGNRRHKHCNAYFVWWISSFRVWYNSDWSAKAYIIGGEC